MHNITWANGLFRAFLVRFVCLLVIAHILALAGTSFAAVPVPGGTYSGPTNQPLNSWSFTNQTTWASDFGDLPMSFTNLGSSQLGNINADSLVVDTNVPAWLRFHVVEATNGMTNLTVSGGSVVFWFAPASWSGANVGSWGLSTNATLLEAGAYTPDSSYGWWSIFVDATGTNLCFAAQTNDLSGTITTYISYPVLWATNVFHCISLTYAPTNTSLYVDGVWATNGPGVTVYPGTNVLANGFWIGSSSNGLNGAHGLFDNLQTYDYPLSSNDVRIIYNWYQTYYELSPYNAAMFGSANASSQSYGTNLALSVPSFLYNTGTVFVLNSTADILYELQSKTNLAQTNWMSEGFVYGSELTNWTQLNMMRNGRPDLFMRLRSWQDDGSGLALWWQLQYFGYTGVDPFGDPMGDGYSNLYKFQHGMDPNVFYTPSAPQNFTLSYNKDTGAVTLNWLPSSGGVTGYILQKSDYQSEQYPTITLSSAATNFSDNIAGEQPRFSGPTLYLDYTVYAQYGTNGNSAPASVSLETSASPSVSIVNGPNGSITIIGQSLPSDLQELRVYRQSRQWTSAGIWYWPYGYGNNYPADLPDGYFSIPAAAITNGIAPIPASQVKTFGAYEFWVQTVRSNGVASGWTGLWNNFTDFVFLDARRQMKDNIRFLLCAATVGGQIEINQIIYPTNYVYSGFHNPDANFNPLAPIEDNCTFRNLTFDVTNLAPIGLPNGVNDDNGISLNNPPFAFNCASLITTNTPIAPASLLSIDQATWLFSGQFLIDPYGWDADWPPPYLTVTGGQNFFGLQYLSEEIVSVTNNNQLNFFLGHSGDQIPVGGFVPYLQASEPQLQFASYYFARVGIDPIPEQNTYSPSWNSGGQQSPFATTNTTPSMFAGVGQSMPQIAGYAQYSLIRFSRRNRG